MDLLPIGCLPWAHCSRRCQGKEPDPAKADLTSPVLERNKAWSLKALGHNTDRGTVRGLQLCFGSETNGSIFPRWLWGTVCVMHVCYTDSTWDQKQSDQSPLDLSHSMWWRGAVKEVAQAFCTGTLTPSLLPSSVPLPGPCYLIHNPSLNCEHRCYTHPQASHCIVYPISWWSVQPQVNHNIHLTDRLGPDREVSITIGTLVIEARPFSHGT